MGFAFKGTPPMWSSKEDWIKNGSTKWKEICKLTHALLATDEGPYPEMVDDELVYPEVPPDPNARGKVVIYVEFTKPLGHFLKVSVSAVLRGCT